MAEHPDNQQRDIGMSEPANNIAFLRDELAHYATSHGTLDGVDFKSVAHVLRIFIGRLEKRQNAHRTSTIGTFDHAHLLRAIHNSVRNARGAIESGQVVDKDVHGTLTHVLGVIDEALADTGTRVLAVDLNDARPADCRFRLLDEGKTAPKSSCSSCGKTIATGLGLECHYLQDRVPEMALHITPTEREVLSLICDGKTVNEIATITGTSYDTVRTHKATLMDKFGVYKDTALVAAAIRSGVIE